MLENRFVISDGTSDYSNELADFRSRTSNINVTIGNYLYVGYYKPINQVYFYLTSGNATETNLTLEKFTNTGWETVKMLDDSTYGLNQSGLIKWQEADNNDKQEETTILSQTGYYYRLSFSGDIDVTAKGVGIVFCDDKDIFLEEPVLDDERYRKHVTKGESDYMSVHLSVKRSIVQEIRNNGIIKYKDENREERLKFFKNITEFDLFDLDEIKQAATMLAVSNIFYKLSDTPDDSWEIKANRYKNEYYKSLNVALVSIDRDDDGELESHENLKPIQALRMSR